MDDLEEIRYGIIALLIPINNLGCPYNFIPADEMDPPFAP
jgi:hypothetical protein